VQYVPEGGQLKTQRTVGNVDRVRTLVRLDRRLSVRLIAEELGMRIFSEGRAETLDCRVDSPPRQWH
jgi:hypothetical protein